MAYALLGCMAGQQCFRRAKVLFEEVVVCPNRLLPPSAHALSLHSPMQVIHLLSGQRRSVMAAHDHTLKSVIVGERWCPVPAVVALVTPQIFHHVPDAIADDALAGARSERISQAREPVQMHLAQWIETSTLELAVHLHEAARVCAFIFTRVYHHTQRYGCFFEITRSTACTELEISHAIRTLGTPRPP